MRILLLVTSTSRALIDILPSLALERALVLVSYFLLFSSLSSSFCAPLCARGFVHVPRGTKASVPKFAFVVVMGTSSVDSTVRGEEEEDKERVVGCDTKRIEADEEEESKAPKH